MSSVQSDAFTPMHQRSISIKGDHIEQSSAFGQAHYANNKESRTSERPISDTNQSVFTQFASSFQIFRHKAKAIIGETLGFYGRPVADYAKAINNLFNECYFLEQWIRELLTQENKRTSEEDTLLTRLSYISKFLQEQIMAMVIDDIYMLLDLYYTEQTNVMLSS